MDFKPKISTLLRHMALAMTLAVGSSMASAGTIHVEVDSANFGVATGYLDMQLTTGGGPLTTALVRNLVGFGPLIDSWGLTAVDGGYLFRSDTANDLYQAVNFGGLLSFDLSFGGDIDPAGLDVPHFLVAAYSEDGFTPLGNFNPVNSSLADFAWTPAATAGIDGTIFASIYDPAVTYVPEPADSLLMVGGLAIMALVLRRRRASGRASPGLTSGFAV
jgi:hypothetical protein